MMNTLIIHSDSGKQFEIPVANGFVSRVVGWIACENIPDALRVADLLNADAATRKQATSKVVLIGDHDPEYARVVDTTRREMGVA